MQTGEKHKRILIAECAAAGGKQLKNILSGHFDVIEAEDGASVAEYLHTPGFAADMIVLDVCLPGETGYEMLAQISNEERLRAIPVVMITAAGDTDAQIRVMDCGALDIIARPYQPQLILHRVWNILRRAECDRMAEQSRLLEQRLSLMELDEKTGLYNKAAFCRHVEDILKEHTDREYVLLRWDMDHFRAFNEIYGMKEGDRFLAEIGQRYRQLGEHTGILAVGHWHADCFVTLREKDGLDPEKICAVLQQQIGAMYPDFEFVIRIGIYDIRDRALDAAMMSDRAAMALRKCKGDYQKHIVWYDETMRQNILDEQKICGEARTALKEGQFVVYFQPQYNYAREKISGAEALVRWNHPEFGLMPPSRFIPMFENSGFISELDLFVWNKTCEYLRSWLDAGIQPVPVSVNMSRKDLYNINLSSTLLNLMEKYQLQQRYLHLEITESAYTEDPNQILHVVRELQSYGFSVEMDDFGSGYSSLNALKDVPVDILKLDMNFLANSTNEERGGHIIQSIISMAHGIHLSVIAEGVETVSQAEYLKEIGCLYMQGFLFSKPVPEQQFTELLKNSKLEISSKRGQKDIEGAADFLSISAQSTLMFNSFVGGAAILEYCGGNVKVLRANDRFLEILQISHSEYVRRQGHLVDIISPDDRKLFRSMLEDSIKSGQEKECALYITGQKTACWLQARTRALVSRAESSLLYLSVDDISDHMLLLQHDEESTRIREILRQALQNAQAANRAKTEFFSNVSHELRTPMNAVIGLAELIRNRAGEPEFVQETAQQIQASGLLLLRQINDVLDMAEFENRSITLQSEAADLDAICSQTESMFRIQCKEKKLDFETHFEALAGRELMVDAVRLQQILFNLLSNAVQYTPEGGKVSFGAKRGEERNGEVPVRFEVADTGIGMSAEFCSQLFEPFSKELDTQNDADEGTGMGLSIAKKIIDMMHGTIQVESTPGEGTVFTVDISLPLYVQPEKGYGSAKNALAGKHLLLVEDNPVNAEICRSLLEKQGAAVVWAENGKIAINYFLGSQPGGYDAVLMDIRMPVMNGLDAARALRALPRADAEKIPIVSLSANAGEEDVAASASAGMNAHLTKPVQPTVLYDTLIKQMQCKYNG